MRYIGIIILLVLCLTLLFFTCCMINTVTSETTNGNLENQEEINQSDNNFQSSSIGPVYETAIEDTEEPVIVDTEETVTVYPQQWATGDGTVENPWANNCLNSALTNCPAGGTIFLKAGYYTLSTTLWTPTKSFNLIGEGMEKSIIVLNITNENGIFISTDYCTLKGFTIDGASQTDDGYSLINIHSCDYTSLEDIEAKNAGTVGINLYRVNHSSLQNIYAHDNYGHGVHPASDTKGRNMYNTYRDIYCWDNGGNGFDDWGNDIDVEQYSVYDNLQCWDNGGLGIAICNQKSSVLSNSFSSGNGEYGIYLNAIEDFTINNCLVTLSDETGIIMYSSENINFTNVIVKNNNRGIVLSGCSNIALTTCQSYDDRDTPLQLYGIELYGTNTGISLLNCKLTPNKEGEIYNPAGVVLTVITKEGVSPSVIVRE